MPRGSKPGERRGGRQRGTLNRATADVKRLAEVYSHAAIQTLAAVMHNDQADVRARIAAANALLDRAHGRPAQAITGADGGAFEMQVAKVVHVHTP